MRLSERFQKHSHRLSTLPEWCVGGLLLFSLLWRGGKSLEMTWLLGLVAILTTGIYFLEWWRVRKQEGEIPEVPLALWVLGIFSIGWGGLSYLSSTTQNYGLDEIIRNVSLVLIFFSMYRKASMGKSGKDFVHLLAGIFSLGVLIACVVGVFVYTLQPVDRFVGTFFDYRFHTDYWPNAWAELLLMGIPVLLYSVWTLQRQFIPGKDTRIPMAARIVLVGFVIGCFALSYSRASLLAFIAEIALWIMGIFLLRAPGLPVKKIGFAGLLVALVALVTFTSVNGLRGSRYTVQDVSDKVTFTASEGTSSISERGQFWDQAITLTKERPIFGWGPYSFRFVQPRLQQNVLATSDHPHNVFLKLAMEQGIPAAVAFLLFFVYIYLISVKVWMRKEAENNEHLFSITLVLLIGCAGVLVHNFVDYNLQFVGIVFPLWLFAAVGFALVEKPKLVLMRTPVARVVEVAIALVMLFVLCMEGWYLFSSSIGRHAEARGDTVKAMKYYNASQGEWFSRDLHLSKVNILFDAGRYATAEEALKVYRGINSEDPRSYKRQGDIDFMQKHYDEAIAAYTTAYQHNRFNDLSVLEGLINAYRATGNTQPITDRKAEVDSLLTSYADAIERNAHFIALSPNVESFVRIANTMAELYPEDAPRYEVMAAKVDHHASIERERLDSRPPGFLW